ncbi:MAG TPA: biotin transporter BioY [Stellaceae bacterium]|nr:biotin transporter BioY [Stellaceae bacterium]
MDSDRAEGSLMKRLAPAPRSAALHDIFRPGTSVARSAVLAIAASLALAVSAKIQVPFWPVPMTMQSLVVLLIGLGYGSRLGAAAILLYLGEGAAGLPVFAGPAAGPGYFLGPTGGYLVGFLLSAIFVGWLAEQGWGRGLPRLTVTLTAGHILLFIPGVAWLAVLFGWSKAIALGVTPFIAATIVKTLLGIALVTAVSGLRRRRAGG